MDSMLFFASRPLRFRAARLFVVLVATSAAALLEPRPCRAAGAKAEVAGMSGMVAEAEKLLPSLVDVQERLRLSCVVAYLKFRGRPSEARRRFQEILAEIDAAAKRTRVGEGDRDNWVDAHGLRVGLAEWMGRTGLQDEARTLLIHEENKYMTKANGKLKGLSKAWNVLDAVPRFVTLGLDAEARAYLISIEEVEEWEPRHRFDTLISAVHAAHQRGDAVAAAAWFKDALVYFRTMNFTEFTPHREIIRAAAKLRAEPEIKDVVNEAVSAKQPARFVLGIQLDYLSMLVAVGRGAEAQAIVARYANEPLAKDFVGIYSVALALAGNDDHAEKVVLTPRPELGDRERFQQQVHFGNLAEETRRAGRFAAAKRFRREANAGGSVDQDDEKLSPQELWLKDRELRYNDAVFAVECGETGALVKVAKEQPYTDKQTSEFVCKCYLATALAAELPHEHAPPFDWAMATYFGFHLFHK